MSDKGKPLALVTGASSGIGRALAKRFAKAGYDLAIVARDGVRLKAVADECLVQYGTVVKVITQDLSSPGAGRKVFAALGDLEADVLVNNAGFGVHGVFADTEVDAELEMVHVQVDAVIEMTKLALPGMLRRGRGGILNIGSVYCFAPVPEQAIYASTKAFLMSFSQSLTGELSGTGVHVTLVCPGITQTEFRERAKMTDTGRFKGKSPEEVADAAYRAFIGKRKIVVLGGASKLFVKLARWLPGGVFLPLMRSINRYRGLKTEK